jgi:hypothetical protein
VTLIVATIVFCVSAPTLMLGAMQCARNCFQIPLEREVVFEAHNTIPQF